MTDWEARALKAEAELQSLEKQEPVGYTDEHGFKYVDAHFVKIAKEFPPGDWIAVYTAAGASPQPSQARELSKDELTDVITAHLYLTYHCTRVWSAWNVGTMSQDDFEPVDESDTPAEIADAIIAAINTKGAAS